ncbi:MULTISPECIES: V-type ATP synthase subunit E [unclassified Haladaptatus]|uniref:V-type ATP synthase subunit E n=1 Tax=unclassified Haladaptatus TaxID=2622732 RepID=UPI002FCE0C0C
MSLETVVEDIREEARARAENIRAEGEERAEELVSEAESDAAEILDEQEREVEREIKQMREQKLSSAKLEAKQKRLEARRNVLAQVRTDVEDAVADLEGDTREELTRELLEDASTEFDDSDTVTVYGRADDAALLETLADDYGYTYEGEYDCLGGVVLESEASRIRVNNTFDSVLDRVWENNLKETSERLFDQ